MADRHEQVVRQFLKHQTMVRDFVLGLVREANDADDIFQEAALVILKQDEMPVSEAEFPKWCRGVAKNKVLHYWRSKRRKVLRVDTELVDAVDSAYDLAMADIYSEGARRKQALSGCVEKLPEPDRRILTLRYDKGEASAAIGKAVRLASQTIRKRLMHIRDVLKRCIDSTLGVENGA